MTIRFLSTVLIFLATMIAICSASSERKEKELSVIFYLDSQQAMPNEFSMKILQDMAEVGSSEYMDIILQIGCTEPLKESNLDEDDKHLVGPVTMPHWKGVRRYVISQEKKADIAEILPEDTMMNSSETLEHFIVWAMEHYNSKHYIVVLMEHGHAWKGFRTMTASEIGDSVRKGVGEGNKITGDNDKIDVFYLQSCLMGSIESVTALESVGSVLITSENPVYALSNRDFDFIFGELLK
ncbi:MAG: clostripain-related cysteine peptidase, partial [Candidatus Eremiobacterota bacterium]